MIVEDLYFITSYEEKNDLFSLSPSSKFILYLLKQRGQLKEKEILNKTLLPKRTVAYALRKLQEKKFIRKFKDTTDKRVSIFESLI
ncbi:MAG: MarR family transcriptional regulator [Promethearchaeota archaeon]|jgi:DNA-binding MarR family transcriptional regulator